MPAYFAISTTFVLAWSIAQIVVFCVSFIYRTMIARVKKKPRNRMLENGINNVDN